MAEIPIKRKEGRNIWPLVIGLVILLTLLWTLFGRHRNDVVAGTTTTDSTAAMMAPTAAIPATAAQGTPTAAAPAAGGTPVAPVTPRTNP